MIEFSNVSKVYPNGVVGLDDVNLTIEQGEFVGIIGLFRSFRCGCNLRYFSAPAPVSRAYESSRGSRPVRDIKPHNILFIACAITNRLTSPDE